MRMQAMIRVLARAATLAVVAIVAACGPLHRGRGEPPSLIVFTNAAMDQATVYVVAPGSDFRRIGTVSAGRTDTLEVPANYIVRGGSVNIAVRLLAMSGIPQTGPVTLYPGDTYLVRLAPDGRMLSFLPGGQ